MVEDYLMRWRWGLSTFELRYNHTLLPSSYAASRNPSVKVTKWGDLCTSSDLSTRWQGHPKVRFGHTRLSLHIAVWIEISYSIGDLGPQTMQDTGMAHAMAFTSAFPLLSIRLRSHPIFPGALLSRWAHRACWALCRCHGETQYLFCPENRCSKQA